MVRLKPHLDPAGAVWFDNLAVTWLWWAQQHYNPPKRPLFSLRGAGTIAVLVVVWGLTLYEWLQPAPLASFWAWIDAVLSVCVSAYAYHRRRHPLFDPRAPLRLAFSRSGILWQSQEGGISQRAWADFVDARIERDDVAGLRVTLVGAEPLTLRSLNPDLAVKVAWACRLAMKGPLDLPTVAQPTPPVRLWKRCPPGGTELPHAIPMMILYPDRLLVFKGLRLLEFRREDIDAFEYPDSGETWLVVTAGDRHPSRIFLPQASPFLEWLTAAPA